MASDAKIETVGSNYRLTIPLLSTIALTIDDGDNTDSTSDDIYVNLKFAGTVVATTPVPSSATAVPEPSTLALSLVAGVSMAVYGIRRRRRA
jgi:hypothetical protein